ncbi:MAG: GTPase [Alphaproteobacteria bacterium]|nr:GTPase [Alphaproteobacteria bacterium]
MVRDTLGEEAVIVATREEKGGRAVRVTAAIEPSFELGRGGSPASGSDWLQYDSEDEESAVTEDITDAMLRHAVPEDVMDHIISCASVIGLEDPGIALIAAIEHLFNFRPLPARAYKKPLMLVGPPGAGKTLATAKLATRGTMEGLKIGVVTTDTLRAGGAEQLEAFTKLLRVDLKRAKAPQDLRNILADLEEMDQIIIDTPGINPFSTDDIKILARLMSVCDSEPVLILPAGGDAQDCGDMGKAFSALGVRHLFPTRLDIARRLGGVLSAAHHGSFTFTDASRTSKVADGLFSLTPKSLAKLLMPKGYRSPETQTIRKAGTR